MFFHFKFHSISFQTDLGTVDEDKMTVNVEEVKLPDPKTPLSTGSTGHAPEVS